MQDLEPPSNTEGHTGISWLLYEDLIRSLVGAGMRDDADRLLEPLGCDAKAYLRAVPKGNPYASRNRLEDL